MEYTVSFGRLGNAKRAKPGPAFRLAVMGDFSGRASKGVLETGADLAKRKPLKVDVDNLDALVERLKVSVSIPLSEDGTVTTVPIASMDDFHPDQLVENVPILKEMMTLRKNVGIWNKFPNVAGEVLGWHSETALPRPPRKARGSKIATDRKTSDFARLTGRKPAAEAETYALIRRIVGPYIVPERDQGQEEMAGRVDVAMSDALRRVLHHPDFQSAEALWRGMEFLVRRIETNAKLQIVVYDISAEELAVDLAASDKLEDSALYSMLVEQPAQDANQGPLSLLAGLYEFEITPPHADLLGRMAQIAAAAGAPFVAGVGPDLLNTPMHDWHPLIKQAWESLRGMEASAYLSLNAPRFLLRMPYGKKTDPIDAFTFEEFTRQGGLSGMLWGHPALLTANLICETWQRDSKAMKIGSIATVDDMPVYIYYDTDGEQIALPCTDRMFTERQIAQISSTGVNPVLSMRGRPEVRMAGFTSLAGGTIAGRWAPKDVKPPPETAPAAPPPAAKAEPEPAAAEDDGMSDLDKLLAGLNDAAEATAEPAAEPVAAEAEAGADDLDNLLASLNAEPEAPAEDETEADLDALLASLK